MKYSAENNVAANVEMMDEEVELDANPLFQTGGPKIIGDRSTILERELEETRLALTRARLLNDEVGAYHFCCCCCRCCPGLRQWFKVADASYFVKMQFRWSAWVLPITKDNYVGTVEKL